ncbi:MAG: hypothetical protein GQ565_13650 [Candidatus Aegiribacteria sp.]|nr:hypothetical protein [Candidatus Aegiribacteria sp.]
MTIPFKMIKKVYRPVFLFHVILLSSANLPARSEDLPCRLIVGYWHNWGNTPNSFLLTQISEAYDVINIAFATPTTPNGSIMQFVPCYDIYPDHEDFIADIDVLQGSGKKVVISIGGANDPIQLNDPADVQNFINSMSEIINTYGFDGVDLDLEGGSLSLQQGDNDFRNPTSPLIVNLIDAINGLYDQLPPGFILSAAPETALMQGGYSVYTGIWGAYLPVIHGLRERLTYIHVELSAYRADKGNMYLQLAYFL